MRLVDLLLHIAAAVFIVSIIMQWYRTWMLCQWFPDMYLLVLWPYSMITNKYLPRDNFFVVMHRANHAWQTGLIFFVLFISYTFILARSNDRFSILFVVFANWFSHLAIDAFTHEGVR